MKAKKIHLFLATKTINITLHSSLTGNNRMFPFSDSIFPVQNNKTYKEPHIEYCIQLMNTIGK